MTGAGLKNPGAGREAERPTHASQVRVAGRTHAVSVACRPCAGAGGPRRIGRPFRAVSLLSGPGKRRVSTPAEIRHLIAALRPPILHRSENGDEVETVLVVITAIYVVLTGALVWIDRATLANQSNPVVCPRIPSANVSCDDDGVPHLETKIEAIVLGTSPAINVLVRGDLVLFETGETARREAHFSWATIPALTAGETRRELVRWPVSELGIPGRDHREISIVIDVAIEYSNAAGKSYTSLFFATAGKTIQTPLDERHSWGLALDTGLLVAQTQTRTRVNRMKQRLRHPFKKPVVDRA